MAEREDALIFLYDPTIRRWEPMPGGETDTLSLTGVPTTEIKSYLGTDFLEEGHGKWILAGSVARYLAEVVRTDPGAPFKRDKATTSGQVLFHGGVQIYKNDCVQNDRVPRVEVKGDRLVAQGLVCYAEDSLGKERDSFVGHIFGGARGSERKIQVIERIAEGYLQQEAERGEAMLRR